MDILKPEYRQTHRDLVVAILKVADPQSLWSLRRTDKYYWDLIPQVCYKRVSKETEHGLLINDKPWGRIYTPECTGYITDDGLVFEKKKSQFTMISHIWPDTTVLYTTNPRINIWTIRTVNHTKQPVVKLFSLKYKLEGIYQPGHAIFEYIPRYKYHTHDEIIMCYPYRDNRTIIYWETATDKSLYFRGELLRTYNKDAEIQYSFDLVDALLR